MDTLREEAPERTTLEPLLDQTTTTSDASLTHGAAESNRNGHLADENPYENIPDELKELKQWVGFKYGKPNKHGKRRKIPIIPTTGGFAAVDNPATWDSFEAAVRAVERFGLDGIGFMFTESGPYSGTDLDDCRDPVTGELEPWALDVVMRLDSYTEASVSGTGVHIITKGKLPGGGGENGNVEMYDHVRYFVATGEHLGGTPTEIHERQDQIDALYREHFSHKLPSKAKEEKAKKASAKHTATLQEVASALEVIPAIEHDIWLRVGMAIHAVDSEEAGFDLWVKWSETCPEKFDLADCQKRWKSFTPDGGITAKTIFGLAIDHGWRAEKTEGPPEPDWNGEEPSPDTTSQSARRKIYITTKITKVVNDAERALLELADGPHLFQRVGQLSFIAHNAVPPNPTDKRRRPLGAPIVVYCTRSQMCERMSAATDWLGQTKKKEWVLTLPPDWAVETLLERRQWNFPVLTDVISSPTLRADGEIISAPGYDAPTGLFLDTQGVTFPPIPEQPTKDDAVAARRALEEVFSDFPFAAEKCGKSAALAGILSLVARPAIDGNVPLFLLRASTRGTGKGLLIDTITTIATGRTAPCWAQAKNEEEDRKALLTIGLEGDACVHIDNLTHPLGSGPLDSALTARTIKGRLLGQNKSVEAPMNCVFFASGNNPTLVGDTARRVVPIDLESLLENPENRIDFKQPRLLQWVLQERARLVVAALTILRAYFAAGCPPQKLSAYGSFEPWSDLIRSALVWAGGADSCEGRKGIEAEADVGYENLTRLLHCWAVCYPNKAVTLNTVIGDVGQRSADTTRPEWCELGEALAAFDSRFDGKRLDGRRIGYGLRSIKGRVVDKHRLIQTGESHRAVLWAVQSV